MKFEFLIYLYRLFVLTLPGINIGFKFQFFFLKNGLKNQENERDLFLVRILNEKKANFGGVCALLSRYFTSDPNIPSLSRILEWVAEHNE